MFSIVAIVVRVLLRDKLRLTVAGFVILRVGLGGATGRLNVPVLLGFIFFVVGDVSITSMESFLFGWCCSCQLSGIIFFDVKRCSKESKFGGVMARGASGCVKHS